MSLLSCTKTASDTQLPDNRGVIYILIVVIALITIAAYLKHRNLQQEIDSMHDSIKDLDNKPTHLDNNEDNSELGVEISKNSSSLKGKAKGELLARYNKGERKQISETILQSETYASLKAYIDNKMMIPIDDPLWGDLEKLVCIDSPDFHARLLLLTDGRITINEHHLALLIKCGVTPTQMTILVSRTKGTISHRRESLCLKIFNKQLGVKVLDEIVRLL